MAKKKMTTPSLISEDLPIPPELEGLTKFLVHDGFVRDFPTFKREMQLEFYGVDFDAELRDAHAYYVENRVTVKSPKLRLRQWMRRAPRTLRNRPELKKVEEQTTENAKGDGVGLDGFSKFVRKNRTGL